MSDTYQAIYDAVRSRISGGDIGSAVESAIREAGIGDQVQTVMRSIEQIASTFDAPSVKYRPKLSLDGNQWCALLGDNLQEGVAGFGDSPSQAMYNFDIKFFKKVQP